MPMLPALRRVLAAWKLRSPRTGAGGLVICTADGSAVQERNLRRALAATRMRAMARDGDESMVRYVFTLGATIAGIILLVGLVLMFFTNMGARYGIGGALLAVGGVLLAFCWYWDRKHGRPPGGYDRV